MPPILQRAHPLARGLLGCWLFGAPAGGLVRDLAGINHAALQGGAAPSTLDGFPAVSIQASGDYAYAAYHSSLDLQTEVTIEARFVLDSAAGSGAVYIQGLVDRVGAVSNNGYALRIGDGAGSALKPQFLCNDGSEHKLTGPSALTVGQSYHLVASYNGARQIMVLDGVVIAEGALSSVLTLAASTGLMIGGNFNTARPLLGRVSMVRLWRRGLAVGEAQQLYADPYGMFQHTWPRPLEVPPLPSYYRNLIIADGAYAYWRLGESSGTTGQDETAGDRDLTYVASPTLGAAGALSDGDTAMAVNGTTQYAHRAGSTVTNKDLWSMEAWAKPSSLSQHGMVVQQGADNGGFAMAIGQSTGNPDGNGARLLLLRNGSGWHDGGYSFASTTSFVHVVITYTAPTYRIYVNGVETATGSGTIGGITGAHTSIGCGFNSDNITPFRFFAGTIDEVAFYNAVLTPTQIAAHYEARLGEPEPPPVDLYDIAAQQIAGADGSGYLGHRFLSY